MSKKLDEVNIPGTPEPSSDSGIRTLTIAASALTTASLIVNLILQVARHMKKRPMQPDQRDRMDTAALGLLLLKQAPNIVRQVRLLASHVRGPK